MGGPEQHGLFAQRNSSLVMLEDALDEVIALLIFIDERDQSRFLPARALREQVLVVAPGTLRNDGVGCVEDGLHAAIILLECQNARARIHLWKIKNVVNGRGTKRVDALRIITDNEKAFDAGSDIERIEAAGIAVRVDRTPYHMHHKYALFDGRRLLNGSYNWTRGAANDNEENITVTADPELVATFVRHFEALWERLK